MRPLPALLFIGTVALGMPATASEPVEVPIAGPEEPGEKLRFGGRVLDMDGRPLSKAAVVAYNTDSRGFYNPPGSPTRVPRLRGVAVTDGEGRFAFTTIRPGGYPDSDIPAHVHLLLSAPAHRERHLEIWFDDDPRVSKDERRRAESDSGFLVVDPEQGKDGVWSFTCEIRLTGN